MALIIILSLLFLFKKAKKFQNKEISTFEPPKIPEFYKNSSELVDMLPRACIFVESQPKIFKFSIKLNDIYKVSKSSILLKNSRFIISLYKLNSHCEYSHRFEEYSRPNFLKAHEINDYYMNENITYLEINKNSIDSSFFILEVSFIEKFDFSDLIENDNNYKIHNLKFKLMIPTTHVCPLHQCPYETNKNNEIKCLSCYKLITYFSVTDSWLSNKSISEYGKYRCIKDMSPNRLQFEKPIQFELNDSFSALLPIDIHLSELKFPLRTICTAKIHFQNNQEIENLSLTRTIMIFLVVICSIVALVIIIIMLITYNTYRLYCKFFILI